MKWEEIVAASQALIPLLVVLAMATTLIWAVHSFMLSRRLRTGKGSRLQRQVVMILMFVVTVVSCILLLPVAETTRNHLLTLLGLALTAIITLSSTTFAANAMSSFMLRTVKGFRTGDFIQIGSYFGRVTERGLFHTEIQTAERNLVTFPNLHLATNPVTVIRSSGTIVSAEVSLGYDNTPTKIETILMEAAERANLKEPYVHIMELGDFSVTYHIAGFLVEVKHVLTARSNLRRMMIDSLHEAGIEIVSPSFLTRRPLSPTARVMPSREDMDSENLKMPNETAEGLVFDKADNAEELEGLKEEHKRLLAEITCVETHLGEAIEPRRSQLERELVGLRAKADSLAIEIEARDED